MLIFYMVNNKEGEHVFRLLPVKPAWNQIFVVQMAQEKLERYIQYSLRLALDSQKIC